MSVGRARRWRAVASRRSFDEALVLARMSLRRPVGCVRAKRVASMPPQLWPRMS